MEQDKHAFVEDFSLFAEREIGISQTMGRIMGWLLVCEPPQQTLDEISDALDMAKSTISTTIRAMTQIGMVERVSVRGDRRHFYQIRNDFWIDAFERSMVQFTTFQKMAERGLTIISGDNATRQRLAQMQTLYAFLNREMPALLERWHAEQSESKHDESENPT
jgi:predicted transcriptional regulator